MTTERPTAIVTQLSREELDLLLSVAHVTAETLMDSPPPAYGRLNPDTGVVEPHESSVLWTL